MRVRWRSLLLVTATCLALGACGPLVSSKSPGPGPDAGTGLPGKGPAAMHSAALARQNIRQQLAAQNYRAALALVRQEVAGGLSEATLAEEYGRAINGVLKQAEGYREKDIPEQAGPLFRAALASFPVTPAVAARVVLAPPEIAARITACADQLMERGLVAYRSGDMDRAIRTWKSIHVFDPGHPASQKALKTAEVQRANLEKLPAENDRPEGRP